MSPKHSAKLATQVIHEGYSPEPLAGCVAPPIYLSTTFAQEGVGGHKGYEYARTSNPTRGSLEKNMAALERGTGALAFASGMSAISTLIQIFDSPAHIIATSDIYGGTYRAFTQVFARHGFSFSFVDLSDEAAIKAAIRPETKLIFAETPTNPLMRITDIESLCTLAHSHGLKVCVDNTFMTPVLQRPLELGADFVVHSATKYLGGHSDVIGGILVFKHKEDLDKGKFVQKSVGAILSPFDSWLIMRGIKTLAVRMRAHQENAEKIARFLHSHPQVGKVCWPGLEDHPLHGVAAKQASGFGGMISFELKNGSPDQFLSRLKVFTLAESLGAVESLVCVPAKMTHASIPKEEREKNGVTDNLIRLSIGIEDSDDLIQDLKNGIEGE